MWLCSLSISTKNVLDNANQWAQALRAPSDYSSSSAVNYSQPRTTWPIKGRPWYFNLMTRGICWACSFSGDNGH